MATAERTKTTKPRRPPRLHKELPESVGCGSSGVTWRGSLNRLLQSAQMIGGRHTVLGDRAPRHPTTPASLQESRTRINRNLLRESLVGLSAFVVSLPSLPA